MALCWTLVLIVMLCLIAGCETTGLGMQDKPLASSIVAATPARSCATPVAMSCAIAESAAPA